MRVATKQDNVMNISKIVGSGYRKFWDFEGRYRVLKGGRGSKKSTTAALWFIYKMMWFYRVHNLKPNLLVIRRYYNTHKDSTYAQLRWAINRLGVSHLWKPTKSPLELLYKPSGQRIIFRGMDDAQSITSITVDEGELCWTWWEEAFQCSNEKDFDKIDLSIRGDMPAPLFKQHTFTFNPWSERIWLKKRFFDKVASDEFSDDGYILAMTRNYDVNEFLGADDLELFARMKRDNPRRYLIEGEGNWGIAEGLVFSNWVEKEFDAESMLAATDNRGVAKYKALYGMDFGYTNDPTAFIALLADETKKEIYIYDEIYRTHMKNKDIYNAIAAKEFDKVRIAADSADPKTIDELKDLGINRIYGVKKKKGSVRAGIQKLQDYKIYVHPHCYNAIIELSNYVWNTDRETGEQLLDPIDDYNHLMDALRYATLDALGGSNFSW